MIRSLYTISLFTILLVAILFQVHPIAAQQTQDSAGATQNIQPAAQQRQGENREAADTTVLSESSDIVVKDAAESFVIFEDDTLYSIKANLGPFTASERASGLSKRIADMLETGPIDFEKFSMYCEDLFCSIRYDENTITTITKVEAERQGMTLKELSQRNYDIIVTYLEAQKDRSWTAVLHRIFIFLAALILFLIGFRYLNRGLRWIVSLVFKRVKGRAEAIKFNNYEFLSRARAERLILFGLGIIKNAVLLTLIYFYSLLLFTIFPKTEPIALKLFNYVLHPVERFAMAVLGYIPELIIIAIIILAARYLKRFLKFLAEEVEREALVVPGFYPDWAMPTYRLTSIFIYLFTFVAIFPYLPGSDSPAFQGVGVFLGLLLSLGSTTAISNIIAGLVIIYMRAFKKGDRVQIGDVKGDVVEKTMLVTRIRTPKNEEIAIPNAAILNGSTINYSMGAQGDGLIVHTTITIGYDVPWRQVHELMVQAALNTEFILKTPKPFVLQTSLDDFFISYQINGYTKEASKQARIYSNLHANIQDAFNEAGVEILSPHYRAERDGNEVTIPKNWKPGKT
ncbi:mechanosensitive ion channel [Robertkochia marina]|uniref:Mechanosensitive ion channel n=1 Tax=Robertkochia marina TaxID=1227945 RepID=A0A4S3M393_9FLAO|nr:mechanosensitive ion channel domain-containing protein [Robertkochia marina]THD69159.1 mechanosensitive ion channel [Robertkochia marina]TRZ47583.1 mechanosensitive ion channel family protein [Robertkochia marina]